MFHDNVVASRGLHTASNPITVHDVQGSRTASGVYASIIRFDIFRALVSSGDWPKSSGANGV